MLSDRGAVVTTVDSHAEARDVSDRSDWNEWGFLDYSRIDKRITSVLSAYESWTAELLFDYIYCVSVIEHLPADVRRLWINSFATRLKSEGVLLLTVDLLPETERLWNFAGGRTVEPEQLHGTLSLMLEELRASGFTIEELFAKRNISGSRVDVAFIRAKRSIDFPTPTLATIDETLRRLQTINSVKRDEIARLTVEAIEGARKYELLNQELQGSAARTDQMQADLSKLQAALTERNRNCDQLKQQIDSINASICWRITWPIRWLHKLFS
jgi:hypothetical protein